MRRIAVMLAAVVVLTGSVVASGAAQPGVAAQPGMNILIMGSSTTGCAGPSTPERCYVNLIKEERPKDTVTVIGRGGTYVAYGPPAGNWTQTPIPGGHDVVVIQLGINDWYVPIPPSDYRVQVDELLGRVRAANPDAKILWLAAWMPAYTPYAEIRQQMWQDHGAVVAAALITVGGELIDMHPSGDRREAAPRRADPASGWHYNDRGHRELADAVERALPRA